MYGHGVGGFGVKKVELISTIFNAYVIVRLVFTEHLHEKEKDKILRSHLHGHVYSMSRHVLHVAGCWTTHWILVVSCS